MALSGRSACLALLEFLRKRPVLLNTKPHLKPILFLFSLCNSPGICFVDQVGLELKKIRLPLQGCVTISTLCLNLGPSSLCLGYHQRLVCC